MSTESINRRSLLALLIGAPLVFSAANSSAGEYSTDGLESSQPDPLRVDGNIQLQAIGGLGVGHIQSTLGLIGVLADSVSRDIYSNKQLEDLMNGTINGLESPKRMLRRLQDSNITGDDAEFLDRMISVFNALQREARALIAYSKSRKPEDAARFESARRSVLKKLGELTHQDDLMNFKSDSSAKSANEFVPSPQKSNEQVN